SPTPRPLPSPPAPEVAAGGPQPAPGAPRVRAGPVGAHLLGLLVLRRPVGLAADGGRRAARGDPAPAPRGRADRGGVAAGEGRWLVTSTGSRTCWPPWRGWPCAS